MTFHRTSNSTIRHYMRMGLPLFALIASVVAPVQACITIGEEGNPVRIATERALIVWDEKKHIEHFLRQATFDAKERNFGFLVPTPTVPQLVKADSGIFEHLENLTNPPNPSDPLVVDEASSAYAKSASPVRVVKSQQIAGYDAVVLRANDVEGLQKWLKAHGYKSSPDLMKWLQPYIERKWVVTAFKIAKQNFGEREITLSAVRMSFSAETPFYPYREPQSPQNSLEEGASERRLKVYFCGVSPIQAQMETSRTGWNATTLYQKPLATEDAVAITNALHLAPDVLPEGSLLTVLQDDSSPRIGTEDVIFALLPKAGGAFFLQALPKPFSTPLTVIVVGLLAVGGISVYQLRRRGR